MPFIDYDWLEFRERRKQERALENARRKAARSWRLAIGVFLMRAGMFVMPVWAKPTISYRTFPREEPQADD